MDSSGSKINRREFLQKSAVVAAGSAALSSTALSYARIAGANERISLGHIGVGSRGSELDGIVAFLKDQKNVEMTAVCDLWRHNLERAVAANQRYLGRKCGMDYRGFRDFRLRDRCPALLPGRRPREDAARRCGPARHLHGESRRKKRIPKVGLVGDAIRAYSS